MEKVKNNTYTVDTIKPTAIFTPDNNTFISPFDDIIISFNESMKIGSQVLSGELARESNGGVWSSTNTENDTLTISPTNNWIENTSVSTITINAKDLASNVVDELNLTYTVDSTLDHTNPVTSVSPLNTIYNAAFDITFTCDDHQGSGCHKIWYTTDGTEPGSGNFFDLTSNPNPILSIDQSQILKIRAEDIAGNLENTQSINYIVDNQAPTTSVDLEASTGPFKDPINVLITCNELPKTDFAGCETILYSLNIVEQSYSPTETNPSISVLLNTTTTLSYYSVDRAGNKEALNTQE